MKNNKNKEANVIQILCLQALYAPNSVRRILSESSAIHCLWQGYVLTPLCIHLMFKERDEWAQAALTIYGPWQEKCLILKVHFMD